MSSGLWPTMITARRVGGAPVILRALRGRDRNEWEALRAKNTEWLRPWEATSPEGVATHLGYRQLVRQFGREANEGRLQPFVIETEGRLVGQMHLFGIAWGSLCGASAGYWVDESIAGQGIMPLALAAAWRSALDASNSRPLPSSVAMSESSLATCLATFGAICA